MPPLKKRNRHLLAAALLTGVLLLCGCGAAAGNDSPVPGPEAAPEAAGTEAPEASPAPPPTPAPTPTPVPELTFPD